MADLVRQATNIEPELIVGGRGEFTVWVGEKQVARKGPDGFPSDDDVVAAVQKELKAV